MRSSGPAARELSLFIIACETISGEKRDTVLSSGHSLRSFHLTIRVDESLVWETAEVNCLAEVVAISKLQMRGSEEKLMICALSSCICESEGEEERRAFFQSSLIVKRRKN